MDGDEVVQLYVSDPVASTARPERQLRGFSRVHVKAGESVRVTIPLDRDAFALINADMEDVVEKGIFKIQVGASSADIKLEKELCYD